MTYEDFQKIFFENINKTEAAVQIIKQSESDKLSPGKPSSVLFRQSSQSKSKGATRTSNLDTNGSISSTDDAGDTIYKVLHNFHISLTNIIIYLQKPSQDPDDPKTSGNVVPIDLIANLGNSDQRFKEFRELQSRAKEFQLQEVNV